MRSKSTEKLRVMAMKNDSKSEEELTCHFKIDMTNLMDFDLSARSLKRLHFDGLILTKVYIVWAKKVQRSNLS